MLVLVWVFGLLAMVMCQPFYGLEKQILYGFQDPDEIQWRPDVSFDTIQKNTTVSTTEYNQRLSLVRANLKLRGYLLSDAN
ncbi:unnamed protein product [Angiostrongylus costaricensis]|uniref:Neur_chan_LBD domain-containing protein n=1 Tax=Angiostrongylus costaricensis TaxID=334426 RepID=A0A0R3PWA6_ANGCS|nr:unnamed protein product [Angiostrongylus costaricensis]